MKKTIQGHFKMPLKGSLHIEIGSDIDSDVVHDAVKSWNVVETDVVDDDSQIIVYIYVDERDEAIRLTQHLHDHINMADLKSKINESASLPALIISWSESEAGWGQRPDGYSLHKNQEDVKVYIDEYWEEEKARCKRYGIEGTPAIYSRPDDAEGALVVVKGELVLLFEDATNEGKRGFRFSNAAYDNYRKMGALITDKDL